LNAVFSSLEEQKQKEETAMSTGTMFASHYLMVVSASKTLSAGMALRVEDILYEYVHDMVKSQQARVAHMQYYRRGYRAAQLLEDPRRIVIRLAPARPKADTAQKTLLSTQVNPLWVRVRIIGIAG
jgi:hypothetical protein